MRTIITEDAVEAASFIKSGGLAAFPTETVYGLGANAFDAAAVARIFEAKRRPADNPLIVHVSDVSQIADVAAFIPPAARVFIDAFFPGPISLVLPRSANIAAAASAGLDTIGVRMPSYPKALEFLRACAVPVAAPSANISGRPSPTTWQAVREDLDGAIECILKGEPTHVGIESTVVDCSQKVPAILRLGAITLGQLQSLVPETVLGTAADDHRSPGTRHAHYQPRARVIIGTSPPDAERAAFIGTSAPRGEFAIVKIVASVEEYTAELFEFFRECDRNDIQTIVCEPVQLHGLGAALMDRLTRAAAR